MKIVDTLLTNNPCFKANKKITVKGIMLHSVGCAQPDAMVFINGWNKSSYDRACVHAFVDGNNGTIYQTLPWVTRGWHCGGSGNDTHIGIEMCEPAEIKYVGGAKFEVLDKTKALASVKKTYEASVELFAHLCELFNLDPTKNGVIVSHSEGHSKGIASGHADPEHLWNQLGTGYTMNKFRTDVKKKMYKKNQNGVKYSEKYLWNELCKVYGPIGAAGVIGNIACESGLRPNNLQNLFERPDKIGMSDEEYTNAIDNGTYTESQFVYDKAGYGLAQWTYWARKQNFYEFMKNQKKVSIGDGVAQTEYLIKELKGYTRVHNALLSAKTVSEASNAVLLGYEKPANQSIENQQKRAERCQQYYDKYASSSPTSKPVVDGAFLVRVKIDNLKIRKGPGTNFEPLPKYINIGTYTIVEVASGEGSQNGWGKLKSGQGWISLDYVERI